MPGGPERAEVEGSGEALSAGRAAAPGSRVGAEWRGRSDDRVAYGLAERAKPAGLVGPREARPCERAGVSFQAMARAVFFAVAAVGLFVGTATAADPIFVKPGDTVTLPTPIENSDEQGNPGGDTISSMKLIVTGDAAFVTNTTDSAEQSIAPGVTKTFTPSFVVGQDAVEGQIYEVRLKIVSPDAGIDPDPDDPAGDMLVIFTTKPVPVSLDRLG